MTNSKLLLVCSLLVKKVSCMNGNWKKKIGFGGQRQDNCLRLVTITKCIPDCIGFALLRCDWSRKLVPFSQPIRCKIKAKNDLVTRVFPRSRQRGCFYSEFSLALKSISSLLIGCCNYFSFSFTSVNRTTLHNAKERDTNAILVYFRKPFQNYFSSMRTLW